MKKYDWVTQEMFDTRLWELVSESLSTDELFAIPGVYELLSEHLNNEVLESLEETRAQLTCDECGLIFRSEEAREAHEHTDE